jgi:probable HAF family extracellular repeat protein
MVRKLFAIGLIALAACENPAAPVTTEAPEIPPPPPSRKVVSASSVIDLGMPYGALTAHAFDVNDKGDIAGYSVNASGQARAYSWRSTFHELPPLSGYINSYAFGLNNSGSVIGVSQDVQGRNRATVWGNNKKPTDLGTLVSGGQSLGMAINLLGSAVGSATAANGSMRGFYYSFLTRRMTSMGLLSGGTYTIGQDLNDIGWAVGYGDTPNGDRAFLYNAWNGSIEDLGTLPGTISSYALSINNSNKVVGYAFTDMGDLRAFLWENGKMTDLGTLGGSQSVAYGINDQGEIVGFSQAANCEFHAFVYTQQSGMVDLGTLPGGIISYAQHINPRGLAAGIALGPDGREHAVRWNVELR